MRLLVLALATRSKLSKQYPFESAWILAASASQAFAF